MVSEERRKRAKDILRSALARRPEERRQFLADACRDDPTLLPEVEALYQSYERIRSGIEQEADSPLGKKIGKYEVLERVGQGAMGVVYKARDPLMRRVVAIKTMSSEIATEPELHERFFREAQSAGNLSHRNIITIYELGEEGRRPFIAMEFLAGEDLKTKLDRRAKLSLEDRLRWMRETMEGLAHAHRKEVIHRDIKPANIFITREGETKILDFGLARLTSSVATKSGLVMGTPSYMSPEQVRGEKLDNRSDLFSAGATFYELLTFRKPFPGDSIHGVFFKILEGAPEPIPKASPWVPEELVGIVMKTIAKDRETRYASADAVLADLQRIEASLPEKKRALRVEAMGELGRVESLEAKYRQALGAGDETLSARGSEDPAEAATLNELLPADFLGLAEVLLRARQDVRRLEEKMKRLEAARKLIAEAAALEARRDPGGALAKADEALRFAPELPSAAALVDRLSTAFAGRDARWRAARVDQVLREGEAKLQEGSLIAAGERAARALALEPEGPGRTLRTKVQAEVLRVRNQRAAREKAARLVGAARAKLARDDDPSGCLQLLSQALELNPEDSDAQALKEKAVDRLAHLRSLAVEETAAEAIASATLAMRRRDFDLAAREVARAMSQSPDATEIPALSLLLEKAKGEATERKKEGAAPRPEPPRPRDVHRPSPPSLAMWIAGAASVAVLATAGVVGYRMASSSETATREDAPPATTVEPTTVAPLTSTTATLTTAPPATSSARPEPTSTILTTSSAVSTVSSSSTTSSAPSSSTTSTPPPPTTTTAAAVVLRPEEQIAELMRQYESAYETLDVNALGAIYPAVPLNVKNSFQNFKSLDLRMEPISPPEMSRSTAGPTATAVYRVVQTVVPKVGKTTVSRNRATFTFAGVGSAWIIVRVDFREEK
jgi:serine/threonine-protein kinase